MFCNGDLGTSRLTYHAVGAEGHGGDVDDPFDLGRPARRQVRGDARDEGLPVRTYIRRTDDPTFVSVLLEDLAALAGLTLAFAGARRSHSRRLWEFGIGCPQPHRRGSPLSELPAISWLCETTSPGCLGVRAGECLGGRPPMAGIGHLQISGWPPLRGWRP
ncbi:hypothetical protein [Actinomadura miaoliensis]|uniref:Uncharacterized protein n=1 Tax=Actinomadura miaoliensis TaxID=430685 RepID=A0ABP7UYY1_9ACTN